MKLFVLERHAQIGRVRDVTEFRKIDGSKLGEAPRCPKCAGYIGMLPLLPPVRVEMKCFGTGFGDIAFPHGGNELLIKHEFQTICKLNGIVGLSDIGPVEVKKIVGLKGVEREKMGRAHI